ncbi:hypothetical protein PoB_004591200 [Plakobranchus ocellatus]|uniref:Uncharacterized protein n=1 Tax=Plakobranchus ocellatus TaxID=259542 RepID=A0AAV4BJ37_9GAST|nr:hypothetical protein PoB_004591200 [Plakobranchus ocellatus]
MRKDQKTERRLQHPCQMFHCQQLSQKTSHELRLCQASRTGHSQRTVMKGSPPKACPKDERKSHECVEEQQWNIECPTKRDPRCTKTCAIDQKPRIGRKNNKRWCHSVLPKSASISSVEMPRTISKYSVDSANYDSDKDVSSNVSSNSRSASYKGKGNTASLKTSGSKSGNKKTSKGQASLSSSRISKNKTSKKKGDDSEGGSPYSRSGPSPSPCSCGSNSSGSDDIFIDIESQNPQAFMRTPVSCPTGSCRRIRVTVNRRSSSTSTFKRQSQPASKKSSMIELKEKLQEKVDEDHEPVPVISDEEEKKMSYTSLPETLLEAVPSEHVSETPPESPKDSNIRSEESPRESEKVEEIPESPKDSILQRKESARPNVEVQEITESPKDSSVRSEESLRESEDVQEVPETPKDSNARSEESPRQSSLQDVPQDRGSQDRTPPFDLIG